MVSILIPAYNAEDFLERAVSSVLAQTHDDLEVLIIDDASQDDTRAVAEALAGRDPRIRVLPLLVNRGPAAARNAGLSAARGEWVAVLDADDAYMPGRIAELLQIAADENADMVADNLLLYDALAQEIERTAIDPAKLPPADVIGIHRFVKCCKYGGSFNFARLKPMMRRNLIECHKIRYPVALRLGEDFAFYLQLLLANAKFVLTNRAMYVYTQPLGRLSGQPSGMRRTEHDYESLQRFTELLLTDKHVQADTRLAKLIRERSRSIRASASEHVLVCIWNAGSYSRALRACARHPALVLFVASKLLRKALWLLRHGALRPPATGRR